MKTKTNGLLPFVKFINSFFCLVLCLALFGCEWNNLPFVKPAQPPPFAIYKTNGDYFDYVNANFNKDNEPNYYLQIDEQEAAKYSHDGNSGYHLRVHLEGGYILAGEITVDDYFTDLTFNDYLKYYTQTFRQQMDINIDSIFLSHVIDDGPFVEYYEIEYYDVFDYILREESYSPEDTTQGSNHKEFKFRQLLKVAKRINKVIEADSLDQAYRRIK